MLPGAEEATKDVNAEHEVPVGVSLASLGAIALSPRGKDPVDFWESFKCRPCCNSIDESNGAVEIVDSLSVLTDATAVGGGDAVKTKTDETFVLVDKPEQEISPGTRYTGQWMGSYCHGAGSLSLADGSVYSGQLRYGAADGSGTFKTADGSVYEGQWLRDRAHGYGTYNHVNESVYEGEWRADLKCGSGSLTFKNGSKYEGQFLQGSKHGVGTYFSEKGEVVFSGQMSQDKLHGEGKYVFADGRIYEGQWRLDKMSGEGKLTWPDGLVYEGNMQDNLRHGDGMLVWPSGRRYRGAWLAGKPDGIGFVSQGAAGADIPCAWRDGELIPRPDAAASG
eukprot:TRINITY_DN5030_c3_g1_i1.p1 TRINITY_DN5030_c3_g1~~TRINITY_DN5030_c3_g1_i1.p1  ORF type:complete len:336 (-),score=52.36 TRINITY_DN5030_c3_g1_i1:150-1157(-)